MSEIAMILVFGGVMSAAGAFYVKGRIRVKGKVVHEETRENDGDLGRMRKELSEKAREMGYRPEIWTPMSNEPWKTRGED